MVPRGPVATSLNCLGDSFSDWGWSSLFVSGFFFFSFPSFLRLSVGSAGKTPRRAVFHRGSLHVGWFHAQVWGRDQDRRTPGWRAYQRFWEETGRPWYVYVFFFFLSLFSLPLLGVFLLKRKMTPTKISQCQWCLICLFWRHRSVEPCIWRYTCRADNGRNNNWERCFPSIRDTQATRRSVAAQGLKFDRPPEKTRRWTWTKSTTDMW